VSPRVYVAAPFAAGPVVRDAIHPRLVAVGWEPCSRWASEWVGPEDFSRFTPAELRAIADGNDEDLGSADAVLLFDPEGKGRETYSELARAISAGSPVVWVGRPTLSAWRRGVVQARDLDDAIGLLRRMGTLFAEGVRGELLALLASDEPTRAEYHAQGDPPKGALDLVRLAYARTVAGGGDEERRS